MTSLPLPALLPVLNVPHLSTTVLPVIPPLPLQTPSILCLALVSVLTPHLLITALLAGIQLPLQMVSKSVHNAITSATTVQNELTPVSLVSLMYIWPQPTAQIIQPAVNSVKVEPSSAM